MTLATAISREQGGWKLKGRDIYTTLKNLGGNNEHGCDRGNTLDLFFPLHLP